MKKNQRLNDQWWLYNRRSYCMIDDDSYRRCFSSIIKRRKLSSYKKGFSLFTVVRVCESNFLNKSKRHHLNGLAWFVCWNWLRLGCYNFKFIPLFWCVQHMLFQYILFPTELHLTNVNYLYSACSKFCLSYCLEYNDRPWSW